MFLTVCDLCRAELSEEYIQIVVQYRINHDWYNDEIQLCLLCYSKQFPFFKNAHKVRKQIEAEKPDPASPLPGFREELDKLIADLKDDEGEEVTPF